MDTLLTAQTDAAGSNKIFLHSPDDSNRWPCSPVTLYLIGTLGDGESVKAQYHNGAAWVDMYVDGNLVQLTNTDNAKTIYGPLEFRVYKSATSAAVGVGISKTRGLVLS